MFDNMRSLVCVHYFTLHLLLYLKRHKVIGFTVTILSTQLVYQYHK